MAIYFLITVDEFGLIEDPDSLDVPNRLALLLEALRSADEFLKDSIVSFAMRLEITDVEGQQV